jgi:hypothetical protein
VTADHLFGEAFALSREHNCLVSGDEAFGFEPLHHFAHRWATDVQSFGHARLNDDEVVFLQFEDALAVLLECRMMFARAGHAAQSTEVFGGRLDELVGQAD